MEDIKLQIDEILQEAKEYTRTKVELVRIEAMEKVAKTSASFMASAIIFLMMLCVLGFASLAGAYALSEHFGSLYQGFGTVALIYLAVGVLITVFRKKLVDGPMLNFVIALIFKEDEDEA